MQAYWQSGPGGFRIASSVLFEGNAAMSSGSPLHAEPNPYQAPSAPNAAAAANWMTAPVVEILAQTRPWVLFFSVLGFICCGLMVAIGLFGGIFAIASGQAEGALLLLYPILGLLYFFPSRFLLRYAQRIRDLSHSRNATDLEAALSAQKSFWRFSGILVVSILVLYAVLIVLGVVAAMLSLMFSR